MKFRVRVKTAAGKTEQRVIDAPSRFAVYEEVGKEEGAAVVSIEEGAGFALPAWANLSFGGSMKMQDKITFAKNLSAMLSAGLTLSRSLSIMERQAKNPTIKKVVADLEERVKKGDSFSEALASHPTVFSTLFVSMSRAGEESGKLAGALGIVASQMDKAYALEKKIKGAMIYPSIILFAVVVIGLLMLVYVVPTLASTFRDLNVALPPVTVAIIAASDFAAKNALLAFAMLAGVIGAIVLFVRSKVGSAVVLFLALQLPIIGELVRETMSARAARSLSSLLSSGVEMLSALAITADIVGKNVFGKVVLEAAERVKKGEQLSAPFNDHTKLYPLLMGDMIAVGEETGKVSEMLGQIAVYYENDVEERTKDLSTIIEPMLMLFIGTVVGVFAMAMITPIYSLAGKIS